MRTKSPVFARNAEFGDGHIDLLGHFRQLRSRLDTDPEYARSLRGREEPVSAGANFKLAALDPPQTLADGLDPLGRLFSDELQRNVQRLRPRPARIGREALHAFDKARDAGANFRVKIDANEYSHIFASRSGCVGTGLRSVRTRRSPVDHFQRLLRCELADALAIAGEIPFDHLRAFCSREGDVYQTHGFLLGS